MHFRGVGDDPEIVEELRGGEKASSKLNSCQQKRRAQLTTQKYPSICMEYGGKLFLE